jgi:hypothetical protein
MPGFNRDGVKRNLSTILSAIKRRWRPAPGVSDLIARAFSHLAQCAVLYVFCLLRYVLDALFLVTLLWLSSEAHHLFTPVAEQASKPTRYLAHILELLFSVGALIAVGAHVIRESIRAWRAEALDGSVTGMSAPTLCCWNSGVCRRSEHDHRWPSGRRNLANSPNFELVSACAGRANSAG